ncbi:MAG TPA: N-acetylglucosamine-6-phosphate deacetylase [Acidobacteriaceae bacterium]|nr:N-acetylglucosamine-6-phosphate deacetylase [Acidobacteriaceae bacterium]
MAHPLVITAKLLLTREADIEYPVIEVAADGTITSIGTDPDRLAAENTVLTAGLLDVHLHGSAGIDVMNASVSEIGKMQRFLAAHGVTKYLPTTVTAPIDFTLRALDLLADAIDRGAQPDESEPVGIHIEGPFLSHAKRGMHPAEHLQPPSRALFDRLQDAARGKIRLMTIAPEAHAVGRKPSRNGETALELIRYAGEKGVRCSIGHTNAVAAETLAAISAGAVSATHTFNAMRPLAHREPGVLGTVLDDDRLYADLICDGVHVAPPLVRLWMKAKGAGRAILITDALAAAGVPQGEYPAGDASIIVRDGRALVAADLAAGKETLAGSLLTLDRAVAKLQSFTGAALDVASRMASHNPASMLGLPELTRIAPGSPATLNRFDEHGSLVATYIRGRQV